MAQSHATRNCCLEQHGTWSLTQLPIGKRVLGNKWVYKIKCKADGSVERYKIRLIVLGNTQREGVYFQETFAPIAKMVTVQTLLSVASVRNWPVHQMDIHNAFLHGDLEEEVYMRPPVGFQTVDLHHVCRLKKSLYLLQQAPRCWFSKLTIALR